MEASWHGLCAPVKTPPATLARIETEARKALALPEMKERFDKIGLYTVGNSSAEFRPFVANAVKRLGEIVKLAGIQPE
jgi:tripartite-type tricarboxylate transporter receptor subunit TctC